MKKILLITPPLLQPNTPYPATAYLTGYLRSRGYEAAQMDLSVELLNEVFSPAFLRTIFDGFQKTDDANIARICALREAYIATIGPVMRFLRGGDPTLAHQICRPDFLPQAAAFDTMDDLESTFGSLGTQDCAKYLCTLYLHDVSSLFRAAVSPHFGIARYGESIAVSAPDFTVFQQQLDTPPNLIEQRMLALLDARVRVEKPDFVGFSVPFPGNLLAALRCAQYIKKEFPGVGRIMGGGYPTTELRSLTDKRIFAFFVHIILDDGELAIERILSGGALINTYTPDDYFASDDRLPFCQHPGPEFDGLPHELYFSLFERTNPMHRLWSDGRWNKMMLAHGCYWAKCSFCDTSLPYICHYEALTAVQAADQMDRIAAQTGSTGFHFVDEATPPKLLKELSLELLRRGRRYTWWTNIRFEAAFTGDLCRLMSAAGCIAVSGGLEAAGDRLLKLINKGVTVEQAVMSTRNFFYAGIMVHAYLMYGLPGQTLQETIDSLEIVRQMFRAQLIDSAYWHRYAMTLHSPMGAEPGRWGVKRKAETLNPFANNEVRFAENRTYNIAAAGESLRTALDNYLAGSGMERMTHKWFEGKAPATTVEPSLVTDCLIKPDASRLFNPDARLIWLGAPLERTAEGILIQTPSETKELKFQTADADFLIAITRQATDLDQKLTFAEVKRQYEEKTNEKPFAELYHSKKWDRMREYGLLQL
ncbi:MAG: radical SAM protein [Rikenellaceae bacterium]|jgi:radical SAM superfamily enzyme YgiQ (UPF0313 family)|nr:radical SAM protein [Rikenellaceae bacterium]